jgi:hypothetical protein
MARRWRRRGRVPPDLTSLFDVLFIVIFAALIRAAAAQAEVDAARAPAPVAAPAPPPGPVPLDPASLRGRAIAAVTAAVTARPTVVVRVTAAGSLVAIEAPGRTVKLDTPLLEASADADVGVSYLGDRAADLRVCRVVAVQLGVADLSAYLVVVAPDRKLVDLPHALFDGLHRDIDRCGAEQRGVAALVEPGP